MMLRRESCFWNRAGSRIAMNHNERLFFSLVIFTGLLVFSPVSRSVGAQSGAAWQVKLQIPLMGVASALTYMPDGSQIAIGDKSGHVAVFDSGTGKLINTIDTRGKAIEAILITSRGDSLISISEDNKGQLWTVSDWRLVGSLDGLTPTADVSPDGQWLAAQDPEHKIWLWDLTSLKRNRQVGKTGTDGALSLTFTPDGKSLAVAYDYNPYLINLQSKAAVKLPVTARSDLMVKQIDKNTYAVNAGAMNDDQAFSHYVGASRKGSLIAIGRGIFGQPDFVDVYDWLTMKPVARIKPKDDGTVAFFSSDNTLLAIQGRGQVTIWEIASGRRVATIKASGAAPSSLIAKGSSLFQCSPVDRELAVVDGNSLFIYQERKDQPK
jgi:WD40 repeat protein